MNGDIGGYVADLPYLRDFKPMLAPAWLDHVALVCGVEPPARDSFAWCDLGCGQGVTAVILAATHPHGTFDGIDAMPMHIEHARRLAAEAGIGSARFHLADFAAAADLALPAFDYIVAHGVYSWVDEPSRAALRGFVDRHLKPGGLVYVSYNAMPGWARDLPFQRLARELAGTFAGDSAARFAAAAAIARSLADVRGAGAEVELYPGRPPGAAGGLRPGLSRPRIHACRVAAALCHRCARRDGDDRARASRVGDPERKLRPSGSERDRARDPFGHRRPGHSRISPRLLPRPAPALRCVRPRQPPPRCARRAPAGCWRAPTR